MYGRNFVPRVMESVKLPDVCDGCKMFAHVHVRTYAFILRIMLGRRKKGALCDPKLLLAV